MFLLALTILQRFQEKENLVHSKTSEKKFTCALYGKQKINSVDEVRPEVRPLNCGWELSNGH